MRLTVKPHRNWRMLFVPSLAKEAASDARRFAKGAGRHGHFEKPD
jgi:hypothetical protein